ncbi:MAG: hypothetical protein FWF10_06520 [Clostridiales bacterium]|nr:hypothetical protein [Clostridiales bacterium]
MPFLLCLLVGGFIGYFGIEMIMRKTTRVFKKSWKGFCIYTAAMLALLIPLQFDAFGIERYRPQVNQIESASVHMGYYYGSTRTTFENPESIQTLLDWHGNVIASKERLKGNRQSYGDRIMLTYQLNGRTVEREYDLGSIKSNIKDPLLTDLIDILNMPETILSRHAFQRELTERNTHGNKVWFSHADRPDRTLSAAEALRLYYEGILPDMQNGTIGKIEAVFDYPYYDVYKNRCRITLRLSEIVEGELHSETLELYVHKDSANTLAVLKDMGILP